MPRISAFYGIVIEMNAADPADGHFEARYGDNRAQVEIESGAVLAGSLPERALGFAREWLDEHREELEANWQRLLDGQDPKPIDPLP